MVCCYSSPSRLLPRPAAGSQTHIGKDAQRLAVQGWKEVTPLCLLPCLASFPGPKHVSHTHGPGVSLPPDLPPALGSEQGSDVPAAAP